MIKLVPFFVEFLLFGLQPGLETSLVDLVTTHSRAERLVRRKGLVHNAEVGPISHKRHRNCVRLLVTGGGEQRGGFRLLFVEVTGRLGQTRDKLCVVGLRLPE